MRAVCCFKGARDVEGAAVWTSGAGPDSLRGITIVISLPRDAEWREKCFFFGPYSLRATILVMQLLNKHPHEVVTVLAVLSNNVPGVLGADMGAES